jgi:DNA-binding MarR family transcriptional regulator
VLGSLRQIVRAIRLSSHEAEAKLGVSGAQLFVLQQLDGRRGLSLSELAALTLTDQSSVSVVVGRLVTRGLVVRKTSEIDARRAEIDLSPAGRAVLRKSPELAQTRLLSALEQVSERDLETTARVLGAVVETMGAGALPPEMFFEGERAKARRKPAVEGIAPRATRAKGAR